MFQETSYNLNTIYGYLVCFCKSSLFCRIDKTLDLNDILLNDEMQQNSHLASNIVPERPNHSM